MYNRVLDQFRNFFSISTYLQCNQRYVFQLKAPYICIQYIHIRFKHLLVGVAATKRTGKENAIKRENFPCKSIESKILSTFVQCIPKIYFDEIFFLSFLSMVCMLHWFTFFFHSIEMEQMRRVPFHLIFFYTKKKILLLSILSIVFSRVTLYLLYFVLVVVFCSPFFWTIQLQWIVQH